MKRAALPVLAALLALAGCAGRTTRNTPLEVFPDMDRQPKYKPQAASTFFSDGRASRRPVPGTVAQRQLKLDEGYHTGVSAGFYVGRNPETIDLALLRRGQQRFNIYCAPCHDATGGGHGIVAQRSAWLPTNLNDDRVRQMVDGEIFNVISYGRRSMPGYRYQIAERDRWAIVAYLRALERASGGRLEDVPADLREDLR